MEALRILHSIDLALSEEPIDDYNTSPILGQQNAHIQMKSISIS